MAYIAPIHRPSSVRHAIKLNLLDPVEDVLVVAKTNRIEIWSPSEEGIHLVHTRVVHGKISMLDGIRPSTSKTAHLFVGTERFQYFTLAWNPDTQSLDTIQTFVDVAEKHMRDSQSLDRCSVDPSGQHIVMELFEGMLSIAKIQRPKRGTQNYLADPEQVRITEDFIRSSTFLRTSTKVPKFAMLYTDKKERVRLATYRLTDQKGGSLSGFDPLKDRENDLDDLDPGASMLIPVPESGEDQKRYIVRNSAALKAQLGGVIVVGESMLLYLDDESKATVEYAYDESTIFVAWAQYDERRFFLGDAYGNLQLLELQLDGANVVEVQMKVVATISKPSKLVYLGNNLLYVASHEGDQQLLQVDLADDVYEIIQTLPNIAPILDFTVMDMGNRDVDAQTNEYSSGQSRIVTGSGVFQTGSLRSVRSGVGLEDVGLLGDMPDARALFSLKGSAPFGFVDTLVVSFIIETRVFVFDATGEVEEMTDYLGLSLAEPTLLAKNVGAGQILQVTPSRVSVVDIDSSTVISSWNPASDSEITAVSANEAHLLLSVEGRLLVCLDILSGLQEVAQQEVGDNDQVACVHIPQQNNDIGMVGFWSGVVSIVDTKTLKVIHGESLRLTPDSAVVPRDMVMAQVLPESLSSPTLFVSMSDGIVHSFNIDKENYTLSGKKSIVLGTQQPRFEVIPRKDGLVNIFATCEHSSLIYGSEGRIVYSAVTAEDATSICSFDTEAYPDAIVLATKEDIRISAIDNERRTHVNTHLVKEVVRRIAYSPVEKVFGLGCIKQELSKGEEIVTSSFRLVDEVIFDDLGTPFILDDHPGVEIVEAVVRAEFTDSHGQPVERFIVGTSFLDDQMNIDVRGRILIFGIDSNRSPYLVASKKLKGACRCIAILDGKIVATLVKTVVMYSYTEHTSASGKLEKIASYRTATFPIDLAITEDGLIIVADLQKSMSLVQYQKGRDGLPDQLVEVARHFQSCYATAVSHIEGDNFLEADADGNVVVLRRNTNGLTLEDRIRMEVTSEISIGEQVNKIQRIKVDASKNAPVVPRAFLATVEGSLYLFGTIAAEWQFLLLNLQVQLADHVESPGNIPFNKYRSYKTSSRETEEPFRFVDGELVERYLDLPDELQDKIAAELGMSATDIRGLVEELKRLH